MKPLIIVMIAVATWSCSDPAANQRFQSKATVIPKDYVGNWEVKLSNGLNANQLQAGLTIEPSGDSLLWSYTSRLIDSTSGRVLSNCGPRVIKMPVWWDDSLKIIQADHGQNLGYGFDLLSLADTDQLRIQSIWLATTCKGPTGFNSRQLILTRVHAFRPAL